MSEAWLLILLASWLTTLKTRMAYTAWGAALQRSVETRAGLRQGGRITLQEVPSGGPPWDGGKDHGVGGGCSRAKDDSRHFKGGNGKLKMMSWKPSWL